MQAVAAARPPLAPNAVPGISTWGSALDVTSTPPVGTKDVVDDTGAEVGTVDHHPWDTALPWTDARGPSLARSIGMGAGWGLLGFAAGGALGTVPLLAGGVDNMDSSAPLFLGAVALGLLGGAVGGVLASRQPRTFLVAAAPVDGAGADGAGFFDAHADAAAAARSTFGIDATRTVAHVVDGVMSLDRDGDGRISLGSEATSGLRATLTRADTNRDDDVTRGELQTAVAQAARGVEVVEHVALHGDAMNFAFRGYLSDAELRDWLQPPDSVTTSGPTAPGVPTPAPR